MGGPWTYLQQGQARGPVPEESLRALLESGDLAPDTPVWREDLPGWVPAPQRDTPLPACPPPAPAFSEAVVHHLAQARPWVRLMAVMGFISVGFMTLFAMALLIVGSFATQMAMPLGMRFLMGALYLGLGALYFPPALFLNRYASRIRDFQRERSAAELERALAAQTSFWRFVGIMVLVVLCLYALIFVVAMGAALVGFALRRH